MSRIYTDYLNEPTLTIPDKFIDVKTGESIVITKTIHDQIKYHATNNTLKHLVFSALNHYLQPNSAINSGSPEILLELLEIKKLLKQGSVLGAKSQLNYNTTYKKNVSKDLNINDIDDVLDAFGG